MAITVIMIIAHVVVGSIATIDMSLAVLLLNFYHPHNHRGQDQSSYIDAWLSTLSGS